VLGVDWVRRGVMLGLNAIIVLIAVMGGRVTPSFTSSFIGHGDPNVKVRQSPVLDRFVMAATWALLVVDLVWPERWLGGAGGVGCGRAASCAVGGLAESKDFGQSDFMGFASGLCVAGGGTDA